MQVGEMPNDVLTQLNRKFSPGFSWGPEHYDYVGQMWADAANSAELCEAELGIETQQDLEDIATKRVIDAFGVLLGYDVQS